MTSQYRHVFRIALTADFFSTDGSAKFRDVGLSVLREHPGVEYTALKEFYGQLQNTQLNGISGLITMGVGITANSLARADDLLAIARFGVGYDDIDVNACTEADIVFLTTPGAVDRSMAEATVTWMLALSHYVRAKDQLVRQGRWDLALDFMGCELRDRTFGSIGFGGIAKATVKLLNGWDMGQPLAYDPYVPPSVIESYGAKPMSLNDVMAQADFVSIHCPLNNETRNLITKVQLSLMKKDAYLINTARGGIVNEDDLFEALSNDQIAGAAIDCFVGEPFSEPHRFSKLENALLAPHAIGLTNEIFRDIGAAALRGIVELAYGRKPVKGIINPEVFLRESFQDKWERLRVAES
jgi:phosphoglycerate dehydrogenase-like enzyme